MSSNTLLLLTGAALCTLLAGCGTQAAHDDQPRASTGTPAASTAGSGRCDSASVQDLIGKTLTPSLAEESRQRAGALVVRVVRPQDPMTMDYDSQRLTLTTSATLVVQTASCG